MSNTIRGAVASWSKSLSNELGSHGITVNNVLPGYTATERLQELIKAASSRQGLSENEVIKNWKAKVPLGRFAEAQEVANAVAFLASPMAAYITGINLPSRWGEDTQFMKFDIFFAICQTPVDGYTPDEKTMFKNFFEQFLLADELGFGIGWIAETHLSCQIQKQNPGAVPHFQGEIGLNTDILQMAHWLYARTKRIEVGSAIRNILCNGGPISHAESIRTFLSIHSMDMKDERGLNIGFASGRFPFSNTPYGIYPRNDLEKSLWPILKGRIFQEATEIFVDC